MRKRQLKNIEWSIGIIAIILCIIGLVALFSATQENEYDEFGRKILELYFYGGNGYHYMSDFLGDHNRDEQEFDYVSYRYRTAEGDVGHSSIPADEAYEKYKIRLIYWEASPPIENSFK